MPLLSPIAQKRWDAAKAYFKKYPNEVKMSWDKRKNEAMPKKANKAKVKDPKAINNPKQKKPGKYSFLNIKGMLYGIGGLLGEGAFAKVKKAFTEDGRALALKIEGAEPFGDEMEIIKRLGHLKNLVTRCLKKDKDFKGNLIKQKYYKLLELIEGKNLYKALYKKVGETEIKRNELTEIQRLIIAIKCCQYIQAIHTKQVVHADIKPENFMVSIQGEQVSATAIDFNISMLLPKGASRINNHPYVVGTPLYMAPEGNKGTYGFATDVYSLGVIFKRDLDLAPHLYKDMLNVYYTRRPTLDTVIKNLNKELEIKKSLEEAKLLQHTLLVPVVSPANSKDKPNPNKPKENVDIQVKNDNKNNPPLINNLRIAKQPAVIQPEGMKLGLEIRSIIEREYEEHDGMKWKNVSSKIDFSKEDNNLWISNGKGSNREKLLFDSASPKMNELKGKLLQSCRGQSVPQILSIVSDQINALTDRPGMLREQADRNLSKKLMRFIDEKRIKDKAPVIHMDTLIEKKLLICRHKALIAAALIGYLIKKNILPEGSARIYRSEIRDDNNALTAVHSWATYRNMKNAELWICDPRMQNILSANRLFHEKVPLNKTPYGTQALIDMTKRLNRLDIYNAFIEEFNIKRFAFSIDPSAYIRPSSPTVASESVVIQLPEEKLKKEALLSALNDQKINFKQSENNRDVTIELNINPALGALNFMQLLEAFRKKLSELRGQPKDLKRMAIYMQPHFTGELGRIVANNDDYRRVVCRPPIKCY